ncbi:MAG: GNAT family N-acetyltransferase [Marmoricola sp.]
MPRQGLEIREAHPEDAPDLVELWSQAGHGTVQPPQLAAEAPTALAHIAADPDERLMVGMHEDKVVASLHLRRGPISPLHTEQVVHTSFLLVLPEFRRHGYAQALMDSAVTWAEEKGVDHVTAITVSSSRDANRYLARLGLATAATVRMASTGTVRKKLSPERRVHGSRRHVGQVLAQRRTMRRRQTD